VVPVAGIEPATFGLQNRCSTAELNRLIRHGAGRASSLARPGGAGNGQRPFTRCYRLAGARGPVYSRVATWGARIVVKGWRVGLGLVGLAGLVVAGVYGGKAWEAEWAKRNPEAARIAHYEKVFDAAWKTVDEKYYDPKFDHERWRRVRDVYRPRVKAQTFVGGLYINVLHNMMQEIGTSHIGVKPPMELLIAERPKRSKVAAPLAKQTCLDAAERTDFGLDFAQLRRGRGRALIVDAVRRGGSAERAGIAPGDSILEFSTANPRVGCPSISIKLATAGDAPRTVTYDLERASGPPKGGPTCPVASGFYGSTVRQVRIE
jgi:hypothetical protein